MLLSRYYFVFLLVVFSFVKTTAQKKTTLPPGIDHYIEKVLQTFRVPGVGVAIVKDGRVLMAKGYGTKRMGENKPVDENTLFLIASNSKAFTATSLAILVEDGKLRWDDKVINHLPWFRMSDDYVTSHMTIRDLLVHHSGLPAYGGDIMLFPPSKYTRRQILDRLRNIPLKYDFRTTYAYDNILYLVAGEVIAEVSGMSWEDFVKKRIFDKVGMEESVSRYSALKANDNFSFGHARNGYDIRIVENFRDRNIGDAGDPAGGICSSASDMARWLITQLDSGRTPSQEKIFTPAATAQLWKVVTPMPVSKVPEAIKPSQQNFWGYGLGFRSYNYGKYKVVGHGGALRGFVSQIAMVPGLDLGVVVLTNQHTTGAYWSIINHVLDYYMQNPSFDWIGGYKKISDSATARSQAQKRKVFITRDSTDKPSIPLERYGGTYTEELMGKVTITKEDTGLVLRFENSDYYIADLAYFQYNNFIAKFRGMEFPTEAYVSFQLNPDGTIDGAKIKVLDPDSYFDFEELVLKPFDEKIHDTAELHKAISVEFAKHPEGVFAVAVKELSSGRQFFINAHDSYHAASTMKTPVLIEAYKQAKAGKFKITDKVTVKNEFKSIVDGSAFSLDSINDSEHGLYRMIGKTVTIYDLLYRMITMSSNLATNIVIDLVGAENVNETMRSMGAKDMQVLRGVEDNKAYEKGMNNMVTAYDLMMVLEGIASGKAVDQRASDEMIKILTQQHFTNIIAKNLPSGVKVASKSGSISFITHDSGIVFLPDGRKYVVVLLSRGVKDHKAVSATMANVSKLIYNYVK